MAGRGSRNGVFVPSVLLLLLLSAQLCSAGFLDGDELSPGALDTVSASLSRVGTAAVDWLSAHIPSGFKTALGLGTGQQPLPGLEHPSVHLKAANPSLTADATTVLVNNNVTLTSTYTDNVPATNALKIFIALFNSSQTIASKPGSVSNTGLTLATNYIVSTPQEITFGSAVGAIISLKRNGSQVHGQGSDFVTVTWEPPPTTTLSSPTGDLRAGQSTRLTATVTDIPVLVNRTRPAQSRQLTDVSLDFLITRSGGDTDQVSGIADLNNPGFYADYTWPAPGSYIVTTETRLSGVKGVATSTNSLNLNVLAATPVDFTRIFLFARKADASYSDRTHLKAAVLDTAGQPLPGVSVTFTLVHACASKQLEYMPCVDTQQAVTDSDGEAVISCRGPTDEDAYAIARARNNRGTLISSRRMSLWPEDHDGYAAAQAVP